MGVAKSAEAFRTISEAAEEIDVPQHVLRHWEEVFGQIRPMRRAGGRRYYRPVDLDVLRGVRVLLYDERYTTKGVQKIFKENGVKYVAEIGRLAASGEQLDLKPAVPDLSSTDPSAPAAEPEAGAQIDATASAHAPDFSARLEAIIARLQRVEAALDEAALALEAIEASDAPDALEAPASSTDEQDETENVLQDTAQDTARDGT